MIEVDKTFEIDYTDQSGMCTFARCPAKYLFDRLMGLKHPDSNTLAVDYGTDMHAAFPHCYEDDISCIALAHAEFCQGWAGRQHGEDDKKRNSSKARESMAEFQRTHKPSVCPYDFVETLQDISAPTADLVSPNELPFIVDVGAKLPFAGRIDAVVKMKSTGGLWALDYKTAGEISARYFSNFEGCPQAVGYTRALSLIMSQKVEGLIVEAIRVSPKNVENQMHHVFVNEHQIKLFEMQLRAEANAMLTMNKEKIWPQVISHCSPYSAFYQPGRVCEYSDLCHIGDWREMVKYYKQSKPFHPFRITR